MQNNLHGQHGGRHAGVNGHANGAMTGFLLGGGVRVSQPQRGGKHDHQGAKQRDGGNGATARPLSG